MDNHQTQTRFTAIEPWSVTEERFRPEDNEIAESIFSPRQSQVLGVILGRPPLRSKLIFCGLFGGDLPAAN